MRILYMANNWIGWQVLKWLKVNDEEIIGLVIHPEDRRKYGDELIHTANLPSDKIFIGSKLKDPDVIKCMEELRPDIGISVLFGYILKPEFIDLFSQGLINLHPALLPYNRGTNPNVWSIVEGTPAGVTLHYIDKCVDTGDIIAQKEVSVESIDTGEMLYHKLERASVELFTKQWHLIRSGKAQRKPQPSEYGTSHKVKDLERIDKIDLDAEYNARDLINIIRARTYSPYPGAYFQDGEKKIYMRLGLFYEENLK